MFLGIEGQKRSQYRLGRRSGVPDRNRGGYIGVQVRLWGVDVSVGRNGVSTEGGRKDGGNEK